MPHHPAIKSISFTPVATQQITTDKAFDDWMLKVDHELVRMCGLSSADLADCCYRDWYDRRVTPKGAAKRAIASQD